MPGKGVKTMEEKTLWEGGPSQLVNLGLFVVCGLLFWTVIPSIMILAAYLRTKNTRYELTNQRLRITTGTLARRVDEIELYRVKDSTVVGAVSPTVAGTWKCRRNQQRCVDTGRGPDRRLQSSCHSRKAAHSR